MVPQFTGHFFWVYPKEGVSHFQRQLQYVVICSIIFHTTISPLSPLHLYQSVSYYQRHLEVMVKEGDDLRQDQLGILGFHRIPRYPARSGKITLVLKIGFQMSSRTEEFIFCHLFSRIQLLHVATHLLPWDGFMSGVLNTEACPAAHYSHGFDPEEIRCLAQWQRGLSHCLRIRTPK